MSDLLEERSPAEEISYIEGWLSAYDLLSIPQAEVVARQRTAEAVASGFRRNLEDLRISEGLRKQREERQG